MNLSCIIREPRVIAVAEDVALTDMYGQREQDRKVRREIANSNERRRMQSINAGFKSLKTILPHSDGDKLSKVRLEKIYGATISNTYTI